MQTFEDDRLIASSFSLPGGVHPPAPPDRWRLTPQRRCDRMKLSHPDDPPIAARLHKLLLARLREGM